MHPPFFPVDHKIGPDIYDHDNDRPVVRRGAPERLNLTITGWPCAPYMPATMGDGIQLQNGVIFATHPHLQIVPPPQTTWRAILGRWMIRTGQRLILQNRPG